ncbi:hypothetical protein ACFFKC_04505 [Pseudoduganella danionis]|uniref:PH domain-containing protein n=1 Tax=Pseudoduganella danionis TaxID=1890295 RepID=A0ABW9SHC1_9BURK|nr:hypothetical protein [Pseudoduganella danionis]MTW31225.1 hypothetical protein [Pseudoduganella danionis]
MNTPTPTLSHQDIEEESLLHIVCPTQKRLLPVLLAGCWCLMFIPAIARHLSGPSQDYAYAWLAITLSTGALFAILLYRSYVFRDELCIVRGSSAPKAYKFLLSAETIRAVRVLPSAQAWSSEGKLESLGLSDGRIEIETSTQSFRFGAGLDEYSTHNTVNKILRFCGLN